jgi:hypothetical protein
LGGGADGASGVAGFFFFGVAALLALTLVFVPRGSWKLLATIRPVMPQPFLCLLERPG